MNIQEFGALKVGDKICNPMLNNSVGVVSAILNYGVKVQWPPSTTEFEVPVNSTTWMHWNKVDAVQQTAEE